MKIICPFAELKILSLILLANFEIYSDLNPWINFSSSFINDKLIIDNSITSSHKIIEAGNHRHQLIEWAHFKNILKLFIHIAQRESAVFEIFNQLLWESTFLKLLVIVYHIIIFSRNKSNDRTNI